MNSLGPGSSFSRARAYKAAFVVVALFVPLLVGLAPPAHAIGETLSVNDVAGPEGNVGSNGALTFRVTLSSAALNTVTVNYATATLSGSARAKGANGAGGDKADYQPTTGTLTFSPGQTTKNVVVPLFGDATPEPNETFALNLSGATGGTSISDNRGIGTVQNDDGVPAAVSIADKAENEGNAGTSVFGANVITLSKASDQPITINLQTSNGTATTADSDYAATTSSVTIPAGVTTASASVNVTGDTKVEANETYNVNITSVDNASIADGNSVATITNDDGVPAISVNSPDPVTESSGGNPGIVNFTITTNKPSTDTLLVDYTTQDATATAANDYVAKSGTLTFSSGQQSKTVAVTLKNNAVQEANETFKLVLSNPTNATLGTAQGTATIVDDEAKPTVSIADKSVVEGTGGTNKLAFTLTLSAASGIATSVHYKTNPDSTTGAIQATIATGGAQTDGDYNAVADGVVTFAAGETSKTAEVTLVTDANDDAPNETLFVDLNTPDGITIADGHAVGTITDDDAQPSLTIAAPAAVTEPNDGTNVIADPPFKLVLSHISNRNISVEFGTLDGTATAGVDYGPVTGTLTFTPGSLRPNSFTCGASPAIDACIPVTVFGDNLSEANETYALHLSNPFNVTPGADVSGTINDTPDTLPTVSVGNAGNVTETTGSTPNASFTVSLNTASGQATKVTYTATDGTAKKTGDFATTTGELTFAAGETSKTVLVPITGDSFPEPNETFTLVLSAPVGLTLGTASGSATIVNDDGPAATLAVNNVTVTEGTGGAKTAAFTVTLTGTPGQAVTVGYATADGTATTANSDYTATSGSLTFAVGDTTKTVNVPVTTDSVTEATETFTLNLSNATNASITTATGTGTITDDDVAPIVSIAGVTVVEGDTGTAPANFAVTLDHASSQTVTVDVATSNGTATAGSDYVANSATLSFAPGETSKTFAVLVNGDTTVEENEGFTATLSSPTNATLASGAAMAGGTITDDDAVATLSIGDVTVAEGTGGTSNATVTVTRATSTVKAVTVDYATAVGTATAPDFTAASGTLSFAAGETTKTFTVAIAGDALDEVDETFTAVLSNATNAVISDNTATVTITDDDDAPTLSIADLTIVEGDTGTKNAPFVVTLSAASSKTVTVLITTADDSATGGADYGIINGATMTFTPGDTIRTANPGVIGDTAIEGDETFTVGLSSPANATIADGSATGTITDDDAVAAVAVGDVTIAEGTGGTTNATVTVTKTGTTSKTLTVDYATAPDTATESDFTVASGSLSFAPADTTKTFTVVIAGDALDEVNETFNVTLSNVANGTISDATGVVTITDDDATPSLSVNDVTVAEGNTGSTNAAFTVTLSAASGRTVNVDYQTTNGTATGGSDFTVTTGSLSFAPGETTKTVNVAVLGDTAAEPNEGFTLDLGNAVNATLADGTGAGTITNDDAAPVSVSVADLTVLEGTGAGSTTANVTVSLSAPATGPVTVAYATAEGTAKVSDYSGLSGTLSFATGESSKIISLPINRDALDEFNEKFTLNLSNPTGATIADNQGVVTITDDDATPTITINDVSVTEGNSGTKVMTFTMSLSAASGKVVKVTYKTTPGTATAGTDYTALANTTVSFAAGTTTKLVKVTIKGDTTNEPNETFTVDLSAPVNATLAKTKGTGTITNDD